MRKKTISLAIALVLFCGTLSAVELIPSARAIGQYSSNALELHLFAPTIANPGQVISIEMWTIFDNATSGVSDLAFDHTNAALANTTMSFTVNTNLGPVAPHIHTPSGSFVALPQPKEWVHPGAWMTNYTVPSQSGLYGVHIYANYTVISSPRGPVTSYITQAETTFTVQDPLATASTVSGLGSIDYAILGLVAVAVVLDILLLFWKRSPAKP